MKRRTNAQRSVDAEVRSIEEGHQARLVGDGMITVVSEALPDVHYKVKVYSRGGVVFFKCDHRRYNRKTLAYNQYIPLISDVVPCKHGAKAARRLEREGLLTWSYVTSCWMLTDKAKELVPPPPAQPDDPFAGLPGC